MCVALGVALLPTIFFLQIAFLLHYRLHKLDINFILYSSQLQRTNLKIMGPAYFLALCFLMSYFMQG